MSSQLKENCLEKQYQEYLTPNRLKQTCVWIGEVLEIGKILTFFFAFAAKLNLSEIL